MDDLDDTHICYMGLTEWKHEIGADAFGTTVYPSLAGIRDRNPGITNDQIVEVAVTFRRRIPAII